MTDDWLHDYMEEWRDHGHVLIHAKWTMDGARTLAEAAHALRQRAVLLVRLGTAGFELGGPIHDGVAIVVRPDEESPMRRVEGE